MIDTTHKQITGGALLGEVSSTALGMVVAGNLDSDKHGTDRSAYCVQHYSYNGLEKNHDARMHNLRCHRYIKRSQQYAAVCFLGKHPEDINFNLGFYFLGRLLHCGQDYYAHSNGVAINFVNPDVVLGGYKEGLTFCNPTSGNIPQKLAGNFLGHISLKTGQFQSKYSDDEIRQKCARANIVINEKRFKNPLSKYKKRLCYVLRLQEPEPLPHQYAHLDFGTPFNLASIAMKDILHRSYRDAAAYAGVLSQNLFNQVLRYIAKGPSGIHKAEEKRREINSILRSKRFFDIRPSSDNSMERLNLIEKIQTYMQHPKDKLTRSDCASIFDSCLRVKEDKMGHPLDRSGRGALVQE